MKAQLIIAGGKLTVTVDKTGAAALEEAFGIIKTEIEQRRTSPGTLYLFMGGNDPGFNNRWVIKRETP